MKMKAPQVTRESLIALKTLIRFDFAREVKKVVTAGQDPSINPTETTLKILMLSEMMNEAEQPLGIALAMIEMTGAANAWLPLNDDRYAMYQRIIGLQLEEEDFKGLPKELDEKARALFTSIQTALKKDFDEASLIDPQQEMARQPRAPSPLGARPPPAGTLN